MRKRIILSIVFLLFGIFVYYLYDINFIGRSNNLTIFIRYYIPDICWTMSFFFMSINFTKNICKKDLFINSLYVLFIGILYELFQLFNITNGTFDIIDITIYILSVLIADYIEIRLRRNEYEKNR